MIRTVTLSRAARKALRRAPRHIAIKLLGWVDMVETEGLRSARRIPGYHDEPLRGKRKGQRSIRLSRSWRAIYVILEGVDEVSLVEVREVVKHEY